MEKWLTSKEYRKKFNVSSAALWNRVNINKTVEMKIINGKKYYKANDIEIENNRKNVIYCRVSSDKFIDELEKQENSLREYCIKHGVIPDEIITAISLPSDFKKSKLQELYKMIVNYDIDTVYISATDRIGIVEYPQFELICSLFDTKIVNIRLTSKKYYKKHAFHPSRDTKIMKAVLGNDAGMYGAAKLFIE